MIELINSKELLIIYVYGAVPPDTLIVAFFVFPFIVSVSMLIEIGCG